MISGPTKGIIWDNMGQPERCRSRWKLTIRSTSSKSEPQRVTIRSVLSRPSMRNRSRIFRELEQIRPRFVRQLFDSSSGVVRLGVEAHPKHCRRPAEAVSKQSRRRVEGESKESRSAAKEESKVQLLALWQQATPFSALAMYFQRA